MAKREYLTLYFLCCLFIFFSFSTEISAKIPILGEYYYQVDFSKIKQDQQQVNNNAELEQTNFIIDDEIMNIRKAARAHNRKLSNSEKNRIKQLQDQQTATKEAIKLNNNFRANNIAKLMVEYGLATNQAVGLKILYKTSSETQHQTTETKAEQSIQEIIFSYKYQFYRQGDFTITGCLLHNFSHQANKYNNKYLNLSILSEFTSELKKNWPIEHELAISVRKYLQDNLEQTTSYIISLTNNLQFAHNFSLINYTEYRLNSLKNQTRQKIIYEKLSIAKKIDFHDAELELAIGSFFETISHKSKFNKAGFLVSLWLKL